MRTATLVCSILAIAIVSPAQNTVPLPVVRDAFALERDKDAPEKEKRSPGVRLRDQLQVIVCRSELEGWRKASPAAPDPVLYLNGRLLKGVAATKPAGIADSFLTAETRNACGAAKIAAEIAQKAADDAKAAMDNEKDAAKKEDLRKIADAKAAEAAAAKKKADETPSDAQAVTFYLDSAQVANAETKDVWLQVLAKPWEQRRVAISIGTDKEAWPSDVTVDFERIRTGWLFGWAILFIVMAALFFRYVRSSDIIRDTGTLNPVPPPGTRKQYSLGRTQMAVWTFIIAPALAFIFMVTWNAGAISNGVLVLMGISFSTTLLAAIQDNASPPKPSLGFWNDLIDDGTNQTGPSPSIHRFQMVLFTIILVVIFVAKTAVGLVMPDFDPSLLALMGISNGTYLGFKMQDK